MLRERGTGSARPWKPTPSREAEDALKSYAIVQYDQLFKDRSNR